jgi:hypothetical protein
MRAKIFGLRLPLAMFILLILSFVIVGSSIIYWTLVCNLVDDGNWLHIKTDACELKFPKKWYMEKGSVENGTAYIVNIFSEDFKTVVHLKFYSRVGTQEFMRKNNLSDASLVPSFNAQRLYNWSLGISENATLHFIEGESNITSFIEEWGEKRGCDIHYLFISIRDAYKKQDTFYNTTGLLISLIIDQRLIEIIFYGEEHSWEENQEYFKLILNSIEVLKAGDIFES